MILTIIPSLESIERVFFTVHFMPYCKDNKMYAFEEGIQMALGMIIFLRFHMPYERRSNDCRLATVDRESIDGWSLIHQTGTRLPHFVS